mmetsp:Transcript_43720/g.83463  ORF Transcript_43720/g.83463 Transcript_43720/m.83463 type:complete len:208 (+) Transcript_43720:99-722(+)
MRMAAQDALKALSMQLEHGALLKRAAASPLLVHASCTTSSKPSAFGEISSHSDRPNLKKLRSLNRLRHSSSSLPSISLRNTSPRHEGFPEKVRKVPSRIDLISEDLQERAHALRDPLRNPLDYKESLPLLSHVIRPKINTVTQPREIRYPKYHVVLGGSRLLTPAPHTLLPVLYHPSGACTALRQDLLSMLRTDRLPMLTTQESMAS